MTGFTRRAIGGFARLSETRNGVAVSPDHQQRHTEIKITFGSIARLQLDHRLEVFDCFCKVVELVGAHRVLKRLARFSECDALLLWSVGRFWNPDVFPRRWTRVRNPLRRFCCESPTAAVVEIDVKAQTGGNQQRETCESKSGTQRSSGSAQ